MNKEQLKKAVKNLNEIFINNVKKCQCLKDYHDLKKVITKSNKQYITMIENKLNDCNFKDKTFYFMYCLCIYLNNIYLQYLNDIIKKYENNSLDINEYCFSNHYLENNVYKVIDNIMED